MNKSNVLPHLEIEIDHKNNDSINHIVKHVRKDWNISSVKYKIFNGTTNTLIGCYINDNDMFLIRVYGKNSELFLNRSKEIENILLLNQHGLAADIFCTFFNGYCYKYVVGRVLTAPELSDHVLSTYCAKLLAKLHTLPIQSNAGSELFPTIYRYLELIPKKFGDVEQQDRLQNSIPGLDDLRIEVEYFQKLIQTHSYRDVVFCHNDISCENLVFNQEEDVLHAIDFEFIFPNYAGFDIGNLFDEFAGVSDVDYSLYPTAEFQKWWIKIYLTEYNRLKGNIITVTDPQIHQFFVEVNHFALISHLFWGIWAIMQAHHSDIKFDFLGYAITRLSEYFKKKDDVLSSS